jgi:hypothetical protein
MKLSALGSYRSENQRVGCHPTRKEGKRKGGQIVDFDLNIKILR